MLRKICIVASGKNRQTSEESSILPWSATAKSSDLRRIVQTALERNVKKYDLQLRQLKDSLKREKDKVYGELINIYGYGLPEGATVLEAENYYDDNKLLKIPLDPNLTPKENAQKYFEHF